MLFELANKYANKVEISNSFCSLVIKKSNFQHIKLLKVSSKPTKG